MLTQFFTHAGFDGDHGHSQPWDDMEFRKYPEQIVFRRSIPHGGNWPSISNIVQKMRMADYSVHTVFTWRDPRYMALSQVNAKHVANVDQALDQILRAIKHLDDDFEYSDHHPICVRYEEFVTNAEFRKSLSGLFSRVDTTTFGVRNANSKYTDLERLNGQKLLEINTALEQAQSLGF
jgi:hypothetical protein